MADSYDRYENETGGGGGFVMGLLTGTVLGAGLGMLLAPKAGTELRGQLSEQARNLQNLANEQARNLSNMANEQYRRASETATGWAEKGREFVDKAREGVNRGMDEGRSYTGATTGSNYGTTGSTGSTTGTPYGGGNTGTGGGGDFGRS